MNTETLYFSSSLPLPSQVSGSSLPPPPPPLNDFLAPVLLPIECLHFDSAGAKCKIMLIIYECTRRDGSDNALCSAHEKNGFRSRRPCWVPCGVQALSASLVQTSLQPWPSEEEQEQSNSFPRNCCACGNTCQPPMFAVRRIHVTLWGSCRAASQLKFLKTHRMLTSSTANSRSTEVV